MNTEGRADGSEQRQTQRRVPRVWLTRRQPLRREAFNLRLDAIYLMEGVFLRSTLVREGKGEG